MHPNVIPRLWLFITLLVSCLILCLSTTVHAAQCGNGTRTSLQSERINVPRILRHDQPIGQTRLVLRTEPGGKILWSDDYEGIWFCIGFNKDIKAYVVGGIFEVGAWLPMWAIRYLPENGKSLKPAAFDRSRYLALRVIPSPHIKYIVFIGGIEWDVGHLQVLDVEHDTITTLGPAPAPPPSDFCSEEEPFDWGGCFGDAYQDMEPGIIRFVSEDVLEVSYGADTRKSRAKKRKLRRFKLGVSRSSAK